VNFKFPKENGSSMLYAKKSAAINSMPAEAMPDAPHAVSSSYLANLRK
jgi:hypothetical protein